ncbi:MAG: LptF/LptG family permease [Verrucomicrobiota bacterium]
MKIVDRYILSALIKPFLFCLIAFFFLWIIVDLFNNLSDFVENKAPLMLVLKFYAVQLADAAQTILPVAFFFSLLFVLGNMSHYRELVGFQSGGLSLVRMMVGIFIIALLVSFTQYLLFYDLTPTAKSRMDNTMKEIQGRPSKENIYSEVIYKNPSTGIVWFAQEVNVAQRRCVQVELLVPDSITKVDERKIFAAQAVYNNAQWELIRCRVVSFSENEGPPKIQDLDSIKADFLTVTPYQMVAALRPPKEMRWGELHDFIYANPHPSEVLMAEYKTEHFYRMAYPLVSPILFLFAIAFAVTLDHQSRAAPLFKCLITLFLLFLWIALSKSFGKGYRIPAWIAAFNGIAIFGLIGLYLFGDKVGWVWMLKHRMKRMLSGKSG